VRLRSLDSRDRMISAEIEPELITGMFGRDREKRRPIPYEEFPPKLIQAVLSAEDKRFFDHPGFDPIRILERRGPISDTAKRRREPARLRCRSRAASSFPPNASGAASFRKPSWP
jgi:hypothetical protein